MHSYFSKLLIILFVTYGLPALSQGTLDDYLALEYGAISDPNSEYYIPEADQIAEKDLNLGKTYVKKNIAAIQTGLRQLGISEIRPAVGMSISYEEGYSYLKLPLSNRTAGHQTRTLECLEPAMQLLHALKNKYSQFIWTIANCTDPSQPAKFRKIYLDDEKAGTQLVTMLSKLQVRYVDLSASIHMDEIGYGPYSFRIGAGSPHDNDFDLWFQLRFSKEPELFSILKHHLACLSNQGKAPAESILTIMMDELSSEMTPQRLETPPITEKCAGYDKDSSIADVRAWMLNQNAFIPSNDGPDVLGFMGLDRYPKSNAYIVEARNDFESGEVYPDQNIILDIDLERHPELFNLFNAIWSHLQERPKGRKTQIILHPSWSAKDLRLP